MSTSKALIWIFLTAVLLVTAMPIGILSAIVMGFVLILGEKQEVEKVYKDANGRFTRIPPNKQNDDDGTWS